LHRVGSRSRRAYYTNRGGRARDGAAKVVKAIATDSEFTIEPPSGRIAVYATLMAPQDVDATLALVES
jgi:hypothetical protein